MVVIVNPHAGRGVVGRELPNVEQVLHELRLEHRTVVTDAPGEATTAAREALGSGERFLVAVGGDGTVNEVVNGMIEDDRPVAADAVLGVVAANSGSDFVSTFGLPGDVTRACDYLAGENVYDLDVGKISYRSGPALDAAAEVRYFANVAEAGLGGATTVRESGLPAFLGRSRYFLGFWMSVARFRPSRIVLQADRRSYEGPAHNVFVANGQYYGRGRMISPRSWPGDGALDVLVMKGPTSDAFTNLPNVYMGEHLPHPNIVELKAKRVEIRPERPWRLEADGEPLGWTPAVFEALPRAIRLKI
jgi:diacylglycerol kinase (ATP)